MPKFNVGVIVTTSIEVEADTQEEAEALAIADTFLLCNAEWSIEHCEKLDEDEEEEEDEEDDEEDDDLFDIDNFKFANEA